MKVELTHQSLKISQTRFFNFQKKIRVGIVLMWNNEFEIWRACEPLISCTVVDDNVPNDDRTRK